MSQLIDLSGRLIAAVPVPFDSEGRIDREAQRRYVAHMAGQPIDGVAVWAHTGRGLRLSVEQREQVLLDWRDAFGGGKPVVAAAGASPSITDWGLAVRSAREMADHAARLGADAILVHPPLLARGRLDQDRKILEYHGEIARAGIPLILFYLYEEAGGISYRPEVLSDLLARPEVLGIKVATLNSVMTFQDVARLVVEHSPEKVLITGEDRFLGYSLMCGAGAALIGMAAACTSVQAELIRSHQGGDAGRFLRLNEAVDRLARGTFVSPMEGYIRRMLWCLVHEGVIPETSAHDPWGPDLPASDFHVIGKLVAGMKGF